MTLWNSTFKSPGKPLQRRAPIGRAKSAMSSLCSTPMQRNRMKRAAPKKRVGHDKGCLQACRGELCFIRIPGVCIGGVDTTVPAHSNQARHGKGMGLKADDKYSVPACRSCHAEIDQGSRFSREEKFALWDSAYARWEPVRAKKMNPATAPTVPGRDQRMEVAE